MEEYSYHPLKNIISFEDFVEDLFELYKDCKLEDENFSYDISHKLNLNKVLYSLQVENINNKLMTKKDRESSINNLNNIHKQNIDKVISKIKFLKKEKFFELFVEKVQKVILNIEEQNKKPWQVGNNRSPEDAFNALEGDFKTYVASEINMITNSDPNNYSFTEEFKELERNNI